MQIIKTNIIKIKSKLNMFFISCTYIENKLLLLIVIFFQTIIYII